jgi:MCP family monocarboxylic acid transporter-like MFS transporter 10
MGIAFSVVGIAMLIGTPIEGALLDRTTGDTFIWWKAILFSGVR